MNEDAKINERRPSDVQSGLSTLREALEAALPPKVVDRNLLVATWNIRYCSNVTKKWHADRNDSPKRDLASVVYVAEIISHFDVVAIQEVRWNLLALRYIMKALGGHWAFLLTDVTRGHKGNDERLAFIFDTRRVKPSGLACELVVPKSKGYDIGANAFQRQFARTPYAASFETNGQTLILATFHIYYGEQSEDRIRELKTVAKWVYDWMKKEHKWGRNLVALGDFNVDRAGDPLYKAFTSTGLAVPKELNGLPRTIYSVPREPEEDKYYDQIAWFRDTGDVFSLGFHYRTGGNFNFLPYVFTDLPKDTVGWKISDHFPLWVEFGLAAD